ncbi:MAG: signal peptidase I [Chloroflexota bacterium]
MRYGGAGRLARVGVVLLVLAACVAARLFVVEPYTVDGRSMRPTLDHGQRLLVSRLAYRDKLPQRGDIIVFRNPHGQGDDYVKRVIGLPGDLVELRLGRVYINGAPLAEPYLGEHPSQDFGPTRVRDDAVFVLGDNRGQSEDSRYFGDVALSAIRGKVVARVWPLTRAGMPR